MNNPKKIKIINPPVSDLRNNKPYEKCLTKNLLIDYSFFYVNS